MSFPIVCGVCVGMISHGSCSYLVPLECRAAVIFCTASGWKMRRLIAYSSSARKSTWVKESLTRATNQVNGGRREDARANIDAERQRSGDWVNSCRALRSHHGASIGSSFLCHIHSSRLPTDLGDLSGCVTLSLRSQYCIQLVELPKSFRHRSSMKIL